MAAAILRKTKEKIELFRKRFTGLQNIYGTYDPKTGRSWQVKEPVSDQVVLHHLQGRQPYGVYLLKGSRTRAVAVDFDDDNLDLVAEFAARAEHYQLKAYIERSKSKGYHAWIFFDEKGADAAKARLVAANILEELEAPDTEVFPKQDSLNSSHQFGNFINAPLFGRLVPAGKTVFLDLKTYEPYPDQWALLDSVEPVSESALDDLIAINQWRVIPDKAASQDSQQNNNPSAGFGLPPCAQRMILNGVEQFQRVSCFRLAVHFKRLGLPYDMAIAALKVWSLKNRPKDGKRVITEPEILEQTQYAYERNYRGYGCKSAAISIHCQPDCPVKANKHNQADLHKGPGGSQ